MTIAITGARGVGRARETGWPGKGHEFVYGVRHPPDDTVAAASPR